jgi:hypothetical protein
MQLAVCLAARLGLKVIARGTQHCMGAQSVRLPAFATQSPTAPQQTLTEYPGSRWRNNHRHALHEQRRIQPRRPVGHMRGRGDVERRHLRHQRIWPQPPHPPIVRVPCAHSSSIHRCADTAPSASADPWAPTRTVSPQTSASPSPSCRSILLLAAEK